MKKTLTLTLALALLALAAATSAQPTRRDLLRFGERFYVSPEEEPAYGLDAMSRYYVAIALFGQRLAPALTEAAIDGRLTPYEGLPGRDGERRALEFASMRELDAYLLEIRYPEGYEEPNPGGFGGFGGSKPVEL